jgi:hypothetical protein
MLRNISVAIAATVLVSGLAAAAPTFVTPAFPSSVNDTGPNYSSAAAPLTLQRTGTISLSREVPAPSSVSESMPEMTGGQSHPTMGTGATRGNRVPRDHAGPCSVSESMPEMCGQSHPTMGR